MKFARMFAIVLALCCPLIAAAITIDTVPVGDPGNLADNPGTGLFGRVTTEYRIATTEVTNAQYVEFLNAVAASDPTGLYDTNMGFTSRGGIVRSGASGSYAYSVKADVPTGGPGGTNYTYGDKPVNFVSWFDAARFANWVNNGATAGASTETGAYTMSNGVAVTRSAGATWFLPTENQWYKAAYYDGTSATYYDYPTKSDVAPNNNIPASDTGNSANYYAAGFTQEESYPMTTVGAYTLSQSAYGTYDQAGNLWEWTETYGANSNGTTNTSLRVRRGGAYDSDASTLNASYRESLASGLENEQTGFRLATIPTPAGIPGDYNGNNIVDAQDYVLWRKSPGTYGGDPAGYNAWRAHFGQTPASGTSAMGLTPSSVPEPSCVFLFGLGLLLSLFRCNK
jgi:formylglycine-generating enzyme required for sulfatase activity